MNLPQTDQAANEARWLKLRAVGLYAMFASLWILGSDSVLDLIVKDRETLMQVSTAKGWFFVAVTSALLFWLMRGLGPEHRPVAPALSFRRTLVPLAIAALAVVLLTVAAVVMSFRHVQAHEAERLAAVADLRADEVGQWTRDRIALARFGGGSLVGEIYRRWNQTGDPAARTLLMQRLSDFEKAGAARGAFVIDAHGNALGSGGEVDGPLPHRLSVAVDQALRLREVQTLGPDDGRTGTSQMDILAPLVLSGDPPRAVLAVRMDFASSLGPILNRWPLPTRTGRIMLVDSDGKPLTGTAAPVRPWLADGPQAHGPEAFDAHDDEGVPVLAVVRPVAGTPWWVAVKVDRAEILSDARGQAGWIAAFGAMVLVTCVVGIYLLRERQAVHLKRLEAREEAERLAARRDSEMALRESAELMQCVGDSVLSHMAVLDATGKVVISNAAWREFGIATDRAGGGPLPRCRVGANCLEAMARSGGAAERAAEGIADVLAGKRAVFALEYAHDAGAEGERWFLMNVTPLKISRGGVVVVHSDITELKRTAAELARYRDHLEELVGQRTAELEQTSRTLADRERFLRSFADNLPVAVGYWDRDLRCRFANRPCRTRFGLGPEEILELTFPQLYGADYPDKEPRVLAALAGETRRYATARQDADGTETHFLVDYLPDIVEGEVRGFIVLATEVTELKRAQLQLEVANAELVIARDRAEAANRAKSAFLANMSHEIRTPMNAIIGFADLLKADGADAAQAQRLDHMSGAAYHLLALINDILDLSKIESGKFTLERIDFSLRDCVARATMLVAEQARAKGLELAVDMAHVPDALCGDPTRLSQALLNLLGNAVKFTEHGRIDLRGEVVEEADDGVLLRFEVRDTGIGVAAEHLGNLFKSFEQGDDSTTRRYGGTGLGLALTRHVAELMHGEAGVQSAPGVGSTFWFTARLARAEHPAEVQGMKAQSAVRPRVGPAAGGPAFLSGGSRSKARILVVEDNRFNQEVALAVLKRAGLDADLAPDGRAAIEQAQTCRYDLVLMDLQMPVMDGFDATRALRALPEYQDTPILAVTANVFGETRAACLAAGMDDHIAKPISAQRLCEALARWLPHAAPPQPETLPPGGKLLERLTGIDGFDPAAGLALAGDEEGFARLLHQFIGNHEDGMPGLDNFLATGQREQARRIVHSLSGSTAAIGARMLQQLAASWETAMARGDAMGMLRLAAFDLEYELVHFISALHDRLPARAADDAPTEGVGMSRAQVDTALESLGFLLAAGDFSAQRFHRDIAAHLGREFGRAADDLGCAVRNHDHERALALLEAMRSATACGTALRDAQ